MQLLNRILVATDYSVAGRRAVNRAGQLAKQLGTALHLLHATPDWNLFARWTSGQPQHYDEITLHAQSAMRDEVNHVLREFGVHAQGEIQLGKASEVITRAIDSYQPSMVVAGARGEHEPHSAPAALGGTSLKLFWRMKGPLLFVRGDESPPYRTSLAAVQPASELSRELVLWGTALVPGGDCHVVHSYDAPYSERMRLCGTSTAAIEACILATETEARRGLDRMPAAASPNSNVHLHLVHGNPLGNLVTAIAHYCPQLVVVGRHESERRQPPHESYGSTGLRMAYHTPVDVLVIP
jgi:nucleotide-binding universal stress UspA family protein